jgi:hypothetical protein
LCVLFPQAFAHHTPKVEFGSDDGTHTDRGLSRSYSEFAHLVSALSVTCPQAIVPALPLSQTSAATDEEDDRLIKIAFQKWAVRLTSDPATIRDDETRSFIESDFGVRFIENVPLLNLRGNR